METQTVNHYEVVRAFITELETKRPKDIGDFPEDKVREFWKSLFRVWPAEVERLHWKAEMAASFVLGIVTTLVLMYIYHMFSGVAPELTVPLHSGTI